MKLQATQSKLNGIVRIPASKSHTIRQVAIAALASGDSIIRNPLASSDTLSAAHCYGLMGAKVDISDPAKWLIQGCGGNPTAPKDVIDVGNSGTTLRLALGSAALANPDQVFQFTGDHQIQSRPVGPLLDALNRLGASCTCIKENGKPPIELRGGLTGGTTPLEAPTSQYLSSLLMACPLAAQDTNIEIILLNEAGYVQITLDWLDQQGIQYENQDFKRFIVPGNQHYTPFDLPVPADFSSATFFLCAGALFGGQVQLQGLDFKDSQPDKAVVAYLQAMGADITCDRDTVTLKGGELSGIDIDMNATPDALPAMAVTGAFAKGTTRLLNVPQARNKETDRISCMAQELTKLGAQVEELPDGLIIHESKLTPTPVQGHHDHRIVMALSMAGLAFDRPIEIDTAEAMNVTFPNFVDLMTDLGANMQTSQ
ncbi:MAG: 3-phosphoshikimate 1-carboxyvinyltransferase [Phycisphaeraceae bacterium]|nr:3-phosphoshikimate 1-carboxyvinyltransferase [Phycisphaeraceae bacterium]